MSTEIEVKTDTKVPTENQEGNSTQMAKEGQTAAPKGRKAFKFSVLRICLDGMMTALYIALTLLKVRIGNVQISFAAIPLCFATLTCGLPDGLIVALLGTFVEQLISPYGLGLTTVLWMLPHLIRAAILWIFHYVSKKHGKPLYDRPLWYYVGMLVSALFLTASNTLAMWLDAIIIGYPIEIMLIETIIRFGTGLLSAVVSASILLPVIHALKNFGALKKL